MASLRREISPPPPATTTMTTNDIARSTNADSNANDDSVAVGTKTTTMTTNDDDRTLASLLLNVSKHMRTFSDETLMNFELHWVV